MQRGRAITGLLSSRRNGGFSWYNLQEKVREAGGVYFTERNGTERNAISRNGQCDHGTINLILEYLTQNGLIRTGP